MALRGAWNFNQASGDYTDYSGNGFSAVARSGVSRVAGNHGSGDLAAQYAGRVATAAGAIMPAGLSGLSATMWLRRDVAHTDDVHALLLFEPVESWAGVYVRPNGQVGAFIYLTEFLSAEVVTAATIPVGTWKHIAVVWDGATIRLYIDGVLSPESVSLVGTTSFDVARAQIGGTESYGAQTTRTLNDVRVYSHAIDAVQVVSDRDTQPGGTTPTPAGTIALSGTGAVSLSGRPAMAGALSLSGAGSGAPSGAAAVAALLGLGGIGVLAVSGDPRIAGALGLSGAGQVGFDGAVLAATVLDLGGEGMTTADGVPILAAVLSLSSEGAPAVSGQAPAGGVLALSGSGTLVIHGQNPERRVGLIVVKGQTYPVTASLWRDGVEIPLIVEGVWVDGALHPLV